MRTNRTLAALFSLAAAAAGSLAACQKKEAPAPAAAEAAATPAAGAKIPITTSSEEARAAYLQGRDQFEKLLITDSVAQFQKAISLDENFALAELAMANAAPTGRDFFEHLNRAAVLSEKATDGEKLLIMAARSGANNDAAKQRDYLEELVRDFPDDERAQAALGAFYFGQQDFKQAIAQYEKATRINPGLTTAWNLLGYSYRQNGDYASAEKAFQKYVELIPKDPNPYDSYAELLLKMGRFDDSVAQYRKALGIDPNFINAHQGIAMDLLYAGKTSDAVAELSEIEKKARTDGERRTGLFALTVVYIDGGELAKALASVDKATAIAEKNNDVPAMAFDRGLKGNILLEMGKPDQAKAEFEKGVALVEGSNLSQEIKDNAKLVLHFNLARVALAKKDFAAAKAEAEEFRRGAVISKNPFQPRLAHELAGVIALAEKNYDVSIAELQQANLQNPQNLYRLCQAWQGKGDGAKAADFCRQAADFNTLPNQNYAFVRAKAKAGAATKS
jgi:tetratricopeptide (TPR) repeat protein